jgi:uncharacterized PurR-regulated membrane protein YhhQ (DUF165 family)
VPKISMLWLTSEKPFSAAILLAHFSTAGPSTSTVRPQTAAHKVMMMVARTAAVDGLAAVHVQHVDLTCVGQRLQRPVDGGKANVMTSAA